MSSTVIIDTERCKGCGLCVHFCPKNVLEISDELNKKGYYPARKARPDECLFCGACCLMCPDVAISITDNATSKNEKK